MSHTTINFHDVEQVTLASTIEHCVKDEDRVFYSRDLRAVDTDGNMLTVTLYSASPFNLAPDHERTDTEGN